MAPDRCYVREIYDSKTNAPADVIKELPEDMRDHKVNYAITDMVVKRSYLKYIEKSQMQLIQSSQPLPENHQRDQSEQSVRWIIVDIYKFFILTDRLTVATQHPPQLIKK